MAAFMVASDLMLIIEARHILSDGLLHFFACLAIFSVFLFERQCTFWYLVFEGFCVGCVLACKYTAGGIMLLAFVRQIDFRKLCEPWTVVASLVRIGTIGIIVVLVQIACFWIHLTVLPYLSATPGGIPASVRTGLVSQTNPDWRARDAAAPMLRRMWDLFWAMHRGNMRIRGHHPYSSSWSTWPLATGRWVLYWTREGRHLICMGNVLLWYPVFFAVILSTIRAVLTLDISSEETGAALGWLLSFLPFGLIGRDVFLYHYAIPLIFGVYALTSLIERHCEPRVRGFALMLFGTMAVCGFFLWCPWVYGLETPDFYFRVWNRKWPG
jgi:dolichyl-phosphate-mannose-protein mannosyltransferase